MSCSPVALNRFGTQAALDIEAPTAPLFDLVLSRPEACIRFELPDDRIGDIVIISSENKTLGTSEHRHDLAALNEPLRSSR